MGTVLYTRDGEGLYDHEGYVAHILADGSSARGLWTFDVEQRTVAWRAECTCGWAGRHHDSGGPNTPDDQLHDRILQDWEHGHARALLGTAERVWQLDTLVETVRVAERHLRDGVREALRRGATWDEIAAATRILPAYARRLFGCPTRSSPMPGSGGDLGGGPIPI
jgi:hypothetical protein